MSHPQKMVLMIFIAGVFLSCKESSETKTATGDKAELLSLELKWLEAEFALDTSYISTLIDPNFVGISAAHTTTKRQELIGIYNTMSAMRRDSIFLDSLKLEEAVVNFYGTTAVATFIIHSYKKDKGKPVEKQTRFSDVWVNQNGQWKAVASHGTPIVDGP